MKVMCIDDEFYRLDSNLRMIECPKFGGIYNVNAEINHPFIPNIVYYELAEFGDRYWDAAQFAVVDSNIDELELVNELEMKD